jgi:hypothetical protein
LSQGTGSQDLLEGLSSFPPSPSLTWVSIVAVPFSALNLDRGNLSQANMDNFLPDFWVPLQQRLTEDGDEGGLHQQ